MSKVQYCKAQVEDRTIFFELTPDQIWSQGWRNETVPIHWEVEGQVFTGELLLKDILSLDIQHEK